MSYNYYKLIILSSLILFNSGCLRFVKNDHEDKKEISSSSSSKNVTHHHVKAGETLYSIAFEYGRDHRDIARWNQIRKPYTIFPKQKIRIIPISSDSQRTKPFIQSRSQASTSQKNISVNNKVNYIADSKLKWQWPTKGKVIRTFSIRDPGRRGIDIEGRKGQPVSAAAAGKVVYRGKGLRGYGNLIIVKHNETHFSAYAHTENVAVKEGEKVKLGQRLADMGNTNSDNTKLHFEIRRNGKPVNPIKYLPRRR